MSKDNNAQRINKYTGSYTYRRTLKRFIESTRTYLALTQGRDLTKGDVKLLKNLATPFTAEDMRGNTRSREPRGDVTVEQVAATPQKL